MKPYVYRPEARPAFPWGAVAGPLLLLWPMVVLAAVVLL